MTSLEAPDYWLARLVLERDLGAIYLVACLVALRQFTPLLGERGLLPVREFTAYVPFLASPSLFHLRYSDRLFRGCAWLGLALSSLVGLGLPDAWPGPFERLPCLALWILHVSIV